MRTNSTLSQNSKVMCNFYGGNGYPVKYIEYTEMLKLWNEKGLDISELPVVKPIKGIEEDLILHNEREVEIYIIEPFLQKIGYKNVDWLRQMPIKMGRGIAYYPDYCFFANNTYGEESAKWILESKFSIHSKKQLERDYYQAKSYAVRLQAEFFALSSREGIWIFTKNKGRFDIENSSFFTQNDSYDQDLFHKILQLIGKLKIKSSIKQMRIDNLI